MGRDGGGRPSRWSPYLVRQGVFIATSVAIFMLLRSVDVSPRAIVSTMHCTRSTAASA